MPISTILGMSVLRDNSQAESPIRSCPPENRGQSGRDKHFADRVLREIGIVWTSKLPSLFLQDASDKYGDFHPPHGKR